MLRTSAALLILVGCSSSASAPATSATGQLDAWQTAAPLPTARANHCSATIDNVVLVIGGNTKVGADFVKTDEIHAGIVADDGTITWQLAGHTPSPVTECTATADGHRLFILDGLYDRETDARQVFTAELDPDTLLLGPLTTFATLPQIAISSEAAVHDTTLLMMDTLLPDEGDTTVTLRTSMTSTSTSWATDDWHIGFRAQAQYAFTTHFAYTLGGYTGAPGNPATAEVFVAPIHPDGSIGAAVPTTPLPAPVTYGEAIAVDDFVFVAGGRAQVFGAPGTTTVYAAQILADGTLAPWQTLATPLPMPRTNHELALAGDFLVVTGGAVNGPGDTAAFTARVRF